MEIKLLKQAKADLEYWKKSGNTAIMKRITALLKDIAEHPYTGIGKPGQLMFDLAGKWSRRINAEHRIIYTVKDDMLIVYVLSMKYHYSKK
jgi:toxin YoeB